MGAGRRLLRFAMGSALGAGIGTAIGVLFAPQSGDELQGRITDRIRQAKLAGAQAKAAKEEELIRKYRAEVEDPDALQAEATKARSEAAEAVAAIGLGLNAPGALAAQETAWRAAHPAAGVEVAPAASDERASSDAATVTDSDARS